MFVSGLWFGLLLRSLSHLLWWFNVNALDVGVFSVESLQCHVI